jgi:hypothetical protein
MIYVLVPARDEASTIGLLLWKIRQVFTAFHREYHLIVVNDGSRDATDDVLAPYARALPMTLLTHARPIGYAGSLEVLIREAARRTDRPRRDVAITMQGDFSESPEDLPELVRRIEGGADLVLAARAARAHRGGPARALLALARRALPAGAGGDVVGTLRAYRLSVLEKLIRESGSAPLLGQAGWAADVELLARAARHARKVDVAPLAGSVPEARRAARSRPLAESWRALRAALALRRAPARAERASRGPTESGAPEAAAEVPPSGAAASTPRRRRRGGRRRGKHRGNTEPGTSTPSPSAA